MSKANGNAYQLVAVDKLGSGLEFVDPSTKKSIKRLSLPARPHEIVVSADKKLAYVTIYGDGIYGNNTHRGHQLAVIDLTRREKVGEIELNPFHPLGFLRQKSNSCCGRSKDRKNSRCHQHGHRRLPLDCSGGWRLKTLYVQ
jgi:hypothetical protein